MLNEKRNNDMDINQIKFEKIDFNLESIPTNKEWLETAESEIVHLRAAALVLQRFDDKGLTNATSTLESQETFLTLLENLIFFEKAYKERLGIIEPAIARLLVALKRNVDNEDNSHDGMKV